MHHGWLLSLFGVRYSIFDIRHYRKPQNKKADPVWGHLWIGQNGFVYVKHKRFKENENKDVKQILPPSPRGLAYS
ncbi:hypothetical protein GCM10028804_26780 [Larkinella terrae]